METLRSKRFWLAVGAVLAIVVSSQFGVDEEDVNRIVAVVVAWIVGDSVRPVG